MPLVVVEYNIYNIIYDTNLGNLEHEDGEHPIQETQPQVVSHKIKKVTE